MLGSKKARGNKIGRLYLQIVFEFWLFHYWTVILVCRFYVSFWIVSRHIALEVVNPSVPPLLCEALLKREDARIQRLIDAPCALCEIKFLVQDAPTLHACDAATMRLELIFNNAWMKRKANHVIFYLLHQMTKTMLSQNIYLTLTTAWCLFLFPIVIQYRSPSTHLPKQPHFLDSGHWPLFKLAKLISNISLCGKQPNVGWQPWRIRTKSFCLLPQILPPCLTCHRRRSTPKLFEFIHAVAVAKVVFFNKKNIYLWLCNAWTFKSSVQLQQPCFRNFNSNKMVKKLAL